ncbi:hypothetical protein LTR04_007120 [Oleoguttula sp. CCFEE 6159]|nr:hypothetical protein LTR04_007120 [Oleoguttula sp. CCFEE 6159]
MNAEQLLYMQAELAHLEDELNEIRKEDAQDEKAALYSQSWRKLSDTENNTHNMQYRKVLEIREKLTEYNAALLQYHELCKLYRPTQQSLRCLQRWLSHEDGGDCFLNSFEADAYDMPSLNADLLTMSDSNQQRDLFSAWLGDHFMGWFEARFGHWIKRKDADVEGGLTHYKDTHLNAVSHFVGTLLASLLPAISIFVLYFVQNMLARLGAIMAFSALFAFTLAVFTKATRIEIFAATAAYVSILM